MKIFDQTILRRPNESKDKITSGKNGKNGNLTTQDIEMKAAGTATTNRSPDVGDSHASSSRAILPTTERYNHNGHLVSKGIQPDGESGRKGIHPLHFLKICWRSTSRASRAVNVLWPVVPAAIAVRYATSNHLLIFILNYIAMIPCANLIGFAGQELGRKLHKVLGVILETTLGSVVEIVMFMVLISNDEYTIIQDAILGSILATQLLCLGTCFVVGGLRHDEQTFDEVVGEVGSDLLLTAGFGLIIPAAFHGAVQNSVPDLPPESLSNKVLQISRVTSVLLIIAYAIYVFFQTRTHQSIYDAIFEADEQKDRDRHRDLSKAKLTFTECIIALVISITLVTIIAISLVGNIEFLVVERGVSDSFVGLILVPLVEKFAEHLTAIDEAWDNQSNMALSHILGATIQTSLFNGPLVVIVGWGLNKPMDLNFSLFNIVVLILSILVVGNFLRDQKSNYLEGSLCVIVYINIAVAAYFYPNPTQNVHEPVGQ